VSTNNNRSLRAPVDIADVDLLDDAAILSQIVRERSMQNRLATAKHSLTQTQTRVMSTPKVLRISSIRRSPVQRWSRVSSKVSASEGAATTRS
jgi:hypothetical protein